MIGILSSYLNHDVQLWVTARSDRRGPVHYRINSLASSKINVVKRVETVI